VEELTSSQLLEATGTEKQYAGALPAETVRSTLPVGRGIKMEVRAIESLNVKFRDECWNEHWFLTLPEFEVVIEAWRREYVEERTQSTIGNVTLMEFINNYQDRSQKRTRINVIGSGVTKWEGQ